jgi:hypothetical protein
MGYEAVVGGKQQNVGGNLKLSARLVGVDEPDECAVVMSAAGSEVRAEQ